MTKQTQLTPHDKDALQTSRVPKRVSTGPAPANSGMRHVAIPAQPGQPGLHAHGVSRTESSRLLGNPTPLDAPTLLKRGHMPGNVDPHPAMTPAQKAACPDDSDDVLNEAKK